MARTHDRPLTPVERRYLAAFDRLRSAPDASVALAARREMRRLLVLVRLEAGVADPDSQKHPYRDSALERPPRRRGGLGLVA